MYLFTGNKVYVTQVLLWGPRNCGILTLLPVGLGHGKSFARLH